jgi:mRNA interferase RelE/StbE
MRLAGMSNTYRIVLEKKYTKDLKLIPKNYHASIKEAVELLKKDPRHDGCVKLKGFDKLYRVRVGPYRIIYSINEDVVTIYVLEVEHRKDIYR